jgi:hypothetical protein
VNNNPHEEEMSEVERAKVDELHRLGIDETSMQSTGSPAIGVKLDDEIKRYRKMKFASETENPLAWWKASATSLPLLSQVARLFLCIPATTATSERAFSTASLTISQKRNQLSADKSRDLIFLRCNWSRYKLGEKKL